MGELLEEGRVILGGDLFFKLGDPRCDGGGLGEDIAGVRLLLGMGVVNLEQRQQNALKARLNAPRAQRMVGHRVGFLEESRYLGWLVGRIGLTLIMGGVQKRWVERILGGRESVQGKRE